VFSLLWSRVFMVNATDEGCVPPGSACRKPALVPFGDLINHPASPRGDNVDTHSEVGDASGGGGGGGGTFTYRSLRRLEAGEELGLAYGVEQRSTPNLLLMHDYGFCLPFNPGDVRAAALEPAPLPPPQPRTKRISHPAC
jgi:hypothetical protein